MVQRHPINRWAQTCHSEHGNCLWDGQGICLSAWEKKSVVLGIWRDTYIWSFGVFPEPPSLYAHFHDVSPYEWRAITEPTDGWRLVLLRGTFSKKVWIKQGGKYCAHSIRREQIDQPVEIHKPHSCDSCRHVSSFMGLCQRSIWSYLSNQINPADDQTTPFTSNISGFFSTLFQDVSFLNF